MFAALLACALAATPAPPGVEAAVAATVARLAHRPPRKLSDLEKVLGPLKRDSKTDWTFLMRENPAAGVRFVSARFAIDLTRQRPEEIADPEVAEWTMLFEGGRAALLAELRKRFGAPGRSTVGSAAMLSYGPFFVSAEPDRLPRLSWFGAPDRPPAPPK